MKTIEEGKVSFRFGNSWWAIKYDDPKGSEGDVYRKGVGRISNTKAVDIIANHDGKSVYLIEIKDFRGHRIENKARIGTELAEEIVHKVKDSIPGIIGAARTSGDASWKNCANCCIDIKRPLKVVLHLDFDDKFPSKYAERMHKNNLKVCMETMKGKLDWLGCKVILTDTRTFGRGLPDIAISNKPGARVP